MRTQGGAQGGDPRGGQSGGDARPGYGAYGGRYTAEDARQFSREAQQRRADAEELRRTLAGQGMDTRDLDNMIARMRLLEKQGTYNDPANVQRLQEEVTEGIKAFEYALRRRVEGPQGDALRLGGSDEVPAGFKALVEEYYRSLARVASPRGGSPKR
jgi:hypothetical protein